MGKNARIRKEKKIIDKYGELPKKPTPFPWAKAIFGALLLVSLVMLAKTSYTMVKPQLADWFSKKSVASTETKTTPAATSTAAASSVPQPTSTNQEKKQMFATISTTMGDIKIELFPKEAPKTVDNFKQLANKGYYNGVIFHRVIKDFMIQGGDPTGTGRGGESAFGKPFEDEFNSHKMVEGSLAMANAGPNTNGSQFFIVTSKRSMAYLDGKHTVFGQVVEGLENAYKISNVETVPGDKPKTDIKINNIKIEEK